MYKLIWQVKSYEFTGVYENILAAKLNFIAVPGIRASSKFDLIIQGLISDFGIDWQDT